MCLKRGDGGHMSGIYNVPLIPFCNLGNLTKGLGTRVEMFDFFVRRKRNQITSLQVLGSDI